MYNKTIITISFIPSLKIHIDFLYSLPSLKHCKMKRTDEFIEKITLISNQLGSLEEEYTEYYKKFEGNEFKEQNRCAAEIENIILMLTHELTGQIGFGIQNFKTLLKYIEFRKTYKEYTDDELLAIIDNNSLLNTIQKKEITKTKKEKDTAKIISDWNQTFKNVGYDKLKERLTLKTL